MRSKRKKEEQEVPEEKTQVEMFQSDLLNSLLGHVLSEEDSDTESSPIEETSKKDDLA